MNAEILLMKLEGVRKRGNSQWSAKCPAHDDGSPSLSVRENADGRILLHCFGGCHTRDVVEAIGMQMEDLFPPKCEVGGGYSPVKRRSLITAQQALEILAHEAMIVALVAGDISAHRVVLPAHRQRVHQAAGRVAYLLEQTKA